MRVNLTEQIDTSFQSENNTPNLPGAYGVGGWTANDASVLLNEQYDVWEVQLDGKSARMVTGGEGRKSGTVFRYRPLDPDDRVVPSGKPLMFTATDQQTRATGFYRKANLAAATPPEKVVMLDKAFGTLTKARDADTVVFTLSRFDEFPDLWLSDLSFKDMRKVSDAYPQQAGITWGTSEIIDYVNADGKTLRAILTKPEDFDPNKKYPLMVYIYEELTQGLHSYVSLIVDGKTIETKPLRVTGDPEVVRTQAERTRLYDMSMELHDLQRRTTELAASLAPFNTRMGEVAKEVESKNDVPTGVKASVEDLSKELTAVMANFTPGLGGRGGGGRGGRSGEPGGPHGAGQERADWRDVADPGDDDRLHRVEGRRDPAAGAGPHAADPREPRERGPREAPYPAGRPRPPSHHHHHNLFTALGLAGGQISIFLKNRDLTPLSR
ncbi:hypothetical protein BH23ACI1_BH23ACI1_30000 [soil metagenome]